MIGRVLINAQIILFQIHGMTVCFTKRAMAGKNSPPGRLAPNLELRQLG
jgi:hypothetical protein